MGDDRFQGAELNHIQSVKCLSHSKHGLPGFDTTALKQLALIQYAALAWPLNSKRSMTSCRPDQLGSLFA